MTMLSFLGVNHRLPLFHMAKRFIWLNEEKQRINEFTIGYMINTGLNATKAFREKGEKCMFTTIVRPLRRSRCVISPNVVYIHFSIFYMKYLLTFKPVLIIYPIVNSLIRCFISLSQIKRLSVLNKGRR